MQTEAFSHTIKRIGKLLTAILAAFCLLSAAAFAASDDTGWQYISGQWYYYNSDGHAVEGWKKISGRWYLFDENGAMRTGWAKSGGAWYYLDPDTGAMATGWVEWEDNWYYLNSDGSMATGWKKPSHTWYYFQPDGLMYREWHKIGGTWYYFDPETGGMATGWVEWEDNWYYLNSDGSMATGWRKPSRTWYYFQPNGLMYHGWQKIDGAWYYFDPETGGMATGWAYDKEDENWYYCGSSGKMQTGWKYIAGAYYYLNDNRYDTGEPYGAMAHDVTLDGWELQSNGKLVDGSKVYMEEQARWCKSATSYLVLVDTVACKTGVFYGSQGSWSLWYFWDCAPGADATPTVTGSYTVQSKGYYFDSGISRCYYYTQFYGNYLFHSVLYDHYGNLSDGRVGQRLSHGCVRLPIDHAKWIYNNIPQNTKVYIY